ncbi:ArsR/SmtB family transcription factor [Microlunatus parietis]|uniref:DNA-binding transcriptional ArsR family regulator n=1 Tax=Microlunatus parietis TaxID=682979 RepID=A0A7Y9L9T6_9ACTN|nr:metalloregulator ArsR/SmtB family transcription factor [Microlunatus parietis]NYE69932.1 DNA-binding transcriptional ArsR family regulator [Microlunatus parietis]
MAPEPAAELDLALRALADPNRRAILAVVRTGPRPVGQIAEEVGLSQQTTSHHLGVLRSAGLASRTTVGTRHLFAINTDGLAAVRSYLDDFWPTKLAALKAAIESREDDGRGRV